MVIADLEIHSRYARVCSKFINPISLSQWAKRKGVHLLSSGDITHPLWRREFCKAVAKQEPGLYGRLELFSPQDNKLSLWGSS